MSGGVVRWKVVVSVGDEPGTTYTIDAGAPWTAIYKALVYGFFLRSTTNLHYPNLSYITRGPGAGTPLRVEVKRV